MDLSSTSTENGGTPVPTTRTAKVLALSMGQGLTTIVALISGMVMSRILSQGELATYRQTLLAYQVLVPLLSLGLTHGLYYFLPTETTRLRSIVAEALILILVVGLLFAFFLLFGGNQLLAVRFSNPAIARTLLYIVPLPLVLLPMELLPAVLVVRNQVNKLVSFNILTNLSAGVGVIAACLVWKTPDTMILTKVGLSVVIGLVGIRLMFQTLPSDDWRPRWSSMKSLLAYSIPLVTATALGTLSIQLDKIIVSVMCSPEEFAVYSNGAMEIPLIGILTGSIASVIQPDLRRLVAGGDRQGALALFCRSAEKSAVILLPVMMFLLFSAKPFILTLFSSKYEGSVLPFMLYLMILPIRVALYGPFLVALGFPKQVMYRAAAGLASNLVLSVILVLWLGYIGAIIATVITLYAVNSVWNMTVISQAVGCHWWQVLPFKNLLVLLGSSTLAGLPLLAMRNIGINMPSAVELLCNAIVYILMLQAVARFMGIKLLQEEMRKIYSFTFRKLSDVLSKKKLHD